MGTAKLMYVLQRYAALKSHAEKKLEAYVTSIYTIDVSCATTGPTRSWRRPRRT